MNLFFTHAFIACFSLFFLNSPLQASNQVSGIDGNNEIVAVWHQPDEITSHLQINGSYGKTNPSTTALTEPLLVHAYNPILATSKIPLAQVRAIALCLSNGNEKIQAAVALSTGWSRESIETISREHEIPNNDYQVTISADGQDITATWSSFIDDQLTNRVLSSIDGGATWQDVISINMNK